MTPPAYFLKHDWSTQTILQLLGISLTVVSCCRRQTYQSANGVLEPRNVKEMQNPKHKITMNF